VLESIEVLIFGAGANRVRGGAGADLIQAGAGNDTLLPGAGDTLDGGAGRDLFLLPDTTAGAGGLIDLADQARNLRRLCRLWLLRIEAWRWAPGRTRCWARGVAETVAAAAGDDLVRGAGGKRPAGRRRGRRHPGRRLRP
jgi:Ca2+-binding RTX toxin-like protein